MPRIKTLKKKSIRRPKILWRTYRNAGQVIRSCGETDDHYVEEIKPSDAVLLSIDRFFDENDERINTIIEGLIKRNIDRIKRKFPVSSKLYISILDDLREFTKDSVDYSKIDPDRWIKSICILTAFGIDQDDAEFVKFHKRIDHNINEYYTIRNGVVIVDDNEKPTGRRLLNLMSEFKNPIILADVIDYGFKIKRNGNDSGYDDDGDLIYDFDVNDDDKRLIFCKNMFSSMRVITYIKLMPSGGDRPIDVVLNEQAVAMTREFKFKISTLTSFDDSLLTISDMNKAMDNIRTTFRSFSNRTLGRLESMKDDVEFTKDLFKK